MIKLLSKETIDKIAAGEVVERPENVAKELIENAIDSGASSISAEIRNGGLDLIRVTDNGCGMSKEDLPNAFVRHATSKLSTAEDLSHIRTMGFRGEALASIAGVSRVELITKRPEDLTGYRYLIEGGREIELKEIGIPSGTTVIVRDLFFNVPVRRQFLKSAKTEGSYVRDIVEKAALAHPEISFSFLCDGKQLFHTTGSSRLKDVIYTVYGKDTLNELLPIDFRAESGTIHGYLSKPSFSRNRRDSEIFFVNNRFVKSQVIERAIETAYEGYLMQHKFPFVVLSVDMEPEKVDVNIHPKKTEVRFSDDEKVFDLLFDGVKYTLSHREHIEDALRRQEKQDREKQVHLEPFEAGSKKAEQSSVLSSSQVGKQLGVLRDAVNEVRASAEARDNTGGSDAKAKQQTSAVVTHESQAGEQGQAAETAKSQINGQITDTRIDKREETGPEKPGETEVYEQLIFLDPQAQKNYRFLGQLFETYWLIEYDGALYIIDQHAAHEKVNYEHLMDKVAKQEVTSQNIMPVLLSLPSKLATLLEDHLEEFAAVGFEIENVGDQDFAVRTIPAYLPELNQKELLMEMIESLEDVRPGLDTEKIREKIASMSCKAAVKGNMRLSEPEMRQLTEELLKLKDPYHCPHGRPVMVKFSRAELDRMFKRIL